MYYDAGQQVAITGSFKVKWVGLQQGYIGFSTSCNTKSKLMLPKPDF